ncbi:MAG: CDP-diacylglycerol--glycerol-3-phosphate 3-phosphatidyltransferase [Desulfomonilia bacterium]
MNVANALTISRIGVVPVIVVLLLWDGRITSLIAAILFIAATITDVLDGYFARKYDIVSDLGKLLDPLADKLLIVSVLIMLIPMGRVPAWIAVVIIGREIAVTGLRSIATEKHIVIAANWIGKYKTAFQCAAIIPLLIHYPILGVEFHRAGEFFLWIALFFTLWSGFDYLYGYLKQVVAP